MVRSSDSPLFPCLFFKNCLKLFSLKITGVFYAIVWCCGHTHDRDDNFDYSRDLIFCGNWNFSTILDFCVWLISCLLEQKYNTSFNLNFYVH